MLKRDLHNQIKKYFIIIQSLVNVFYALVINTTFILSIQSFKKKSKIASCIVYKG